MDYIFENDSINKSFNEFCLPRFEVKLPGTKILVIAPHPDDEIIGCGGAIFKHLDMNDSVAVVYLTNGEMSGPDPNETAMVRHEEAVQVMNKIGVKEYYFLDLPDSFLAVTTDSLQLLNSVINKTQPEVICVPHINDRHRDHFAANLLLASALQNMAFNDTVVACYEVWTPLSPNLLINISDYFTSKVDTLKMYDSQVKNFDFIELINLAARYRTMLNPMDKYAIRVAINEQKFRNKLNLPTISPWTHLEAFRVYKGQDYYREVLEYCRCKE